MAADEPIEARLFIDGGWRGGSGDVFIDVFNPASEERLGRVACAEPADVALALSAAARGAERWRNTPPFDRAKVLRRAADLLRERASEIARTLTLEQGKPFAQALGETMGGADILDWFAEEGKRAFGQIIPGRGGDMEIFVRLEPIGPVAAFAPWNFPITQAVRKLAAALAAGCSIILKGPEEVPGPCIALVQALVDAGVPDGAVSLLFGDPAAISRQLVESPIIRKISFTGSTQVGRQLAALAGQHMKRTTMELGGHAPVIVCRDADLDAAAVMLARFKFFNAGQVCIAPTRFLVDASVHDRFLDAFVHETAQIMLGDGMDPEVAMGPLATRKRLDSITDLVADAREHGARLVHGGSRHGNRGFFFEPTILADVPLESRAMVEEPFGPVALFRSFSDIEEALVEANRLPYGLASFAFTGSGKTEALISDRIEAGMLAVNRVFQSLPEAAFGGIKDSGHGTEGGTHALLNFMNFKTITRSPI